MRTNYSADTAVTYSQRAETLVTGASKLSFGLSAIRLSRLTNGVLQILEKNTSPLTNEQKRAIYTHFTTLKNNLSSTRIDIPADKVSDPRLKELINSIYNDPKLSNEHKNEISKILHPAIQAYSTKINIPLTKILKLFQDTMTDTKNIDTAIDTIEGDLASLLANDPPKQERPEALHLLNFRRKSHEINNPNSNLAKCIEGLKDLAQQGVISDHDIGHLGREIVAIGDAIIKKREQAQNPTRAFNAIDKEIQRKNILRLQENGS